MMEAAPIETVVVEEEVQLPPIYRRFIEARRTLNLIIGEVEAKGMNLTPEDQRRMAREIREAATRVQVLINSGVYRFQGNGYTKRSEAAGAEDKNAGLTNGTHPTP